MLALSWSAAARACNLPERHLRLAAQRGEIIPRASGRRSVLIVSELEEWLKNRPAPKSSRRATTNGRPMRETGKAIAIFDTESSNGA
jgi:hypothetical protein